MPDPIDELAQHWRVAPDAPATIALCDALRQASPGARRALVDDVGRVAAEQHASNGQVLLAAARVYADADRLIDAHRMLVSAARVVPRDPAVFRLTGEVLLRRGEAERAEAMFQRAQQLGATDGETAVWLERATALKALQATAGPHAVSIELKGTAVLTAAPPEGAPSEAWHHVVSVDDDGVTAVRARPWDDTDGTQVSASPVRPAQKEPTIELDAFPEPGQPAAPAPSPGLSTTDPLPWRPGAQAGVAPEAPAPIPARTSSAGATMLLPAGARPGGLLPIPRAPDVPAPQPPAPAWPAVAPGSPPVPYSPAAVAAPLALATTAPLVPPGPPARTAPRKSRGGLVVGIVAVLFLVVGGVLVWQFYPQIFTSGSSPPTTPARPPKHGKH